MVDEELVYLLDLYVPSKYKYWGMTPRSKPRQALLDEINRRETYLMPWKSFLLRSARSVRVEVEFTDANGQRWRLKELRILRDGSIWDRNLPASFSETGIEGETDEATAVRGAGEELGIQLRLEFLTLLFETLTEWHASEAYPGLISVTYGSVYVYQLPQEDYQPDGYWDIDENGTITYYLWVLA